MPKIRKQASREMVKDFLESGERLWIRFAKLLKVCEDYTWKAAKKETGEKKPVAMGKTNVELLLRSSMFGAKLLSAYVCTLGLLCIKASDMVQNARSRGGGCGQEHDRGENPAIPNPACPQLRCFW
jgi:hypothetical protein